MHVDECIEDLFQDGGDLGLRHAHGQFLVLAEGEKGLARVLHDQVHVFLVGVYVVELDDI